MAIGQAHERVRIGLETLGIGSGSFSLDELNTGQIKGVGREKLAAVGIDLHNDRPLLETFTADHHLNAIRTGSTTATTAREYAGFLRASGDPLLEAAGELMQWTPGSPTSQTELQTRVVGELSRKVPGLEGAAFKFQGGLITELVLGNGDEVDVGALARAIGPISNLNRLDVGTSPLGTDGLDTLMTQCGCDFVLRQPDTRHEHVFAGRSPHRASPDPKMPRVEWS